MGRVFRPTYTVTDPATGERVEKQTAHFYIEYARAGKTIRRKAGKTAAAAKDALRKAEAEVLAEKNGLPTRRTGDIPLTELTTRYLDALKSRCTPDHLSNRAACLRILLTETRAVALRDLTPERVEQFMAAALERGLSQRTVNIHLSAAKAMLNWCVKHRLVSHGPLDAVSKLRETEKRHARRALSEAELRALLAAGVEGPRRRARARSGGTGPGGHSSRFFLAEKTRWQGECAPRNPVWLSFQRKNASGTCFT